MRTRIEERTLIDEILAGRTDLFEVLVQPTTHMLRRCAVRLLRCREDADEVVQEALWKAFAKLDQFRGDASFRTWLFRILVNEVNIRGRSRHRESRPLFDPPAAVRFDGFVTLAQLLEAERNRCVTQAVGRLPSTYRCVIRLRYLEGRSINETAKVLNLTRAATKALQYRACKMLRSHFKSKVEPNANQRRRTSA